MENTGPNPKPVRGIVMAWPSTDGKAFALRLQLPDSVIDLELDDTVLKQLMTALMQSSVACAQKRTDLPVIKESALENGVQLPVSGIDVLPLEGERKRLVMRVGTVDLNLMIGSATTAKALAVALTT
jgi:hypothetical protein